MMKLSPTSIEAYERCPYAWYLSRVARVSPVATQGNLVFGSTVHEAIETWLRRRAIGIDSDPAEEFLLLWEQAMAETQEIVFSSGWTSDDLKETGARLLEAFRAWWDASGWQVAVDRNGEPLIERPLAVTIDDLLFEGRIDLVAVLPDGTLAVLDVKTPSTAAMENFAVLSDQLTSYQVLMDANADQLGIQQPTYLGFIELIKAKVGKRTGQGPRMAPPYLVQRRRPEDIHRWMIKTLWIARSIKSGVFHQRPLGAWDSPCKLCDFVGWCTQGSLEGLKVPPGAQLIPPLP